MLTILDLPRRNLYAPMRGSRPDARGAIAPMRLFFYFAGRQDNDIRLPACARGRKYGCLRCKLVRVAGFEPTASWSRTMRATGCATPGWFSAGIRWMPGKNLRSPCGPLGQAARVRCEGACFPSEPRPRRGRRAVPGREDVVVQVIPFTFWRPNLMRQVAAYAARGSSPVCAGRAGRSSFSASPADRRHGRPLLIGWRRCRGATTASAYSRLMVIGDGPSCVRGFSSIAGRGIASGVSGSWRIPSPGRPWWPRRG